MMDHRVAHAPTHPATVAVTYTDRSQKANIDAILLSEAFGRCLRDLGQCAQSDHMIHADCYSIKGIRTSASKGIAAQPFEIFIQMLLGHRFAAS